MKDKPEWLESMSVLNLKPGDVLVVKGDPEVVYSPDFVEQFRDRFRGIWPDLNVLFISDGLEIGVVRQEATERESRPRSRKGGSLRARLAVLEREVEEMTQRGEG